MGRSLAAAIGMTCIILTPVVALAAPPPPAVVPVYRGSAPHGQARPPEGHPVQRSVYRAPEINLHPRSLEPNAGALYPSWRAAPEPARDYVLYQPPPWLQAGCLANGFMPSPASSAYTAPQNATIGSLVDNQSKGLFSTKPSYRAGLASSSDATAAPSTSAFSVQFSPTQCAPASSIAF